MFHVKLFDKRPQNFTPTSETCTGRGLQRFCKYGQTDSKNLYNLSRGKGEMRFVARETTIFFVKFTIMELAGIHRKTETKARHVNRGGRNEADKRRTEKPRQRDK